MHHLSGHAAAHPPPSLPVTVPAALGPAGAAVAVVAVTVAVAVVAVAVAVGVAGVGVGVSVGCGNRGSSDAAVSSVLTERRARGGGALGPAGRGAREGGARGGGALGLTGGDLSLIIGLASPL